MAGRVPDPRSSPTNVSPFAASNASCDVGAPESCPGLTGTPHENLSYQAAPSSGAGSCPPYRGSAERIHLSAPAAPVQHFNLLGQPHLAPASVGIPAPTSQLLLQSLYQPEAMAVPVIGAQQAVPAAANLPGAVYQRPPLPSVAALAPADNSQLMTALLKQLTPTQLLQLQERAAMAAYAATQPVMQQATQPLSSHPPKQAVPSVNKVKVLLTYGGASPPMTASHPGEWDYVGDQTRLLGNVNPNDSSYDTLAKRVEQESGMTLGTEGVLRYELPGCPGTLIDLRTDADVANMWAEWLEFCTTSKQPSFKLHLYVDKPQAQIHSSTTSSGSYGMQGDIVCGTMPTTSEQTSTGSARTLPTAGTPHDNITLPFPASVAPTGRAAENAMTTATTPSAAAAGTAPCTPPKQLDKASQQSPAATAAEPGKADDSISLTSFDQLVARVKANVEIIRPSDLRIVRFIGSGGFADCYLAKWLGVEVAVKCLRDLPGAHSSSMAAVRELLGQAALLSGMRHPNVLCLYAVALPDNLAAEYGIRQSSVDHASARASHHHHHQLLETVQEGATSAPADQAMIASRSGPKGEVSASPSTGILKALRQVSLKSDPGYVLGGGSVTSESEHTAGTSQESFSGSARTEGDSSTRVSPETEEHSTEQPSTAKEEKPEPVLAVCDSPFAAASGAREVAAQQATKEAAESTPAVTFPFPGTMVQLPGPQQQVAFLSEPHPMTNPVQQLASVMGKYLPDTDKLSPTLSTVSAGGTSVYTGEFNTDEEEGFLKAIQAAEAAAVASADKESQTALSEGLITRPALVAEFLRGCSLRSAITRKADFLSSDLVLIKVALDTARGMEYCHAKHIIHWNLKTGNTIVGFSADKVPYCKIADVGISRLRQLGELDEAGVARVLPWAAPELVRAPHTATEKVDVYSYGMILWSLWAHKHPFEDVQEVARLFLKTMQAQVIRPPIPGTPAWSAAYPSEEPPKEPAAGWSDLMQRCWAQNPSERPSFKEVCVAMIDMFTTAKAAKRAARAAAKHHDDKDGEHLELAHMD